MSYQRGWQALNLEMPDKIPHTEYISHRPFVMKLTGLDPDDPAQSAQAGRELVRLLDYDLMWINYSPPDQPRLTHMGSAHWYQQKDRVDERRCPFETEEQVLSFDPVQAIGIPDVDELTAYYQQCHDRDQANFPEAVCPGGYYNTVFMWCILTFGWDMFLASAPLDYERFDRVLEGFFQISMASFEAQARTSIKAFICHDDIVWTAGAVFRPDWYRKYVFPRYKKLWAPLKEAGKKLLFCSDGDFTEFVDDLVDCGADGFIFEPLTDLEYVAAKYGRTHSIIGNVDCRVLTFGSPDEIEAEVRRCADIGRSCPGYFFAVGNHIPYNVPIENVELYFDLINRLGRR